MRVLVVEDDPILQRLWGRTARAMDVEVQAACSLAEARACVGVGDFDAVVLDLSLPDGNTLSLQPALSQLTPPRRVALVSGHLNAELAIDVGAFGWLGVPKPIGSSQCRRVLEYLFAGFGPVVARFAAPFSLTDMQRRIIGFALEGLTNVETAERLGRTENTVAGHWRSILEKTGHRSQKALLGAVVLS